MGFFSTIEEMAAALNDVRDYYGEKWEELSDELLYRWVERIREGQYGRGFDFYETV